MFSRRLTALVVAATLPPFGAVVTTASGVVAAASATAAPARFAHPRYAATIRRTEHGIPHITASNFGSLGFGSGYAAARTSTCTLADTLITARGERSRWFGPTKR